MKRSRIAEQNRDEMLARCKRMKPEERLAAFLAHNELVAELYQAGVKYRDGRGPRTKRRKRP